MIKPRIGSYAVYEPPEEGWESWESQFSQINLELAGQGMEVIAAPEAVKDLDSLRRVSDFFNEQNVDLLHALIITWSFDHYTLELLQRIRVPAAIRAIPGIRTGSVVGAQQLASVLADLGQPYHLYYGEIGDSGVAQSVAVYAKACAIRSKLSRSRLGVIGRRTEGMTPTAVDEVEIMRLFGVRLIHYGLDELLERAELIGQDEAAESWLRFRSAAAQVLAKTEHGLQAARNYLACKQIIAQQGLSALTIGSYPKCQGTMCIPIAWLNEEGLPTGCEGDVNSTLNMLILSQLSDEPVHFGEMLALDEHDNTIVTSHCGCGSPSLADGRGFVLSPVRLAHSGVCIRYSAKPGPVSFVNLVGRKNNYRLCCLQGKAVPTEMVFEGNPLKFVLASPIRQVWSQVDRYGFGHHWMTVYAQVTPVLKELCRLIGFLGVFPDIEEGYISDELS
jgi:L-fucose isomerase-like protein